MIEEQNNNSVQHKSGNKSKPLLANRLFRGYSKKHRTWIYGDLIHTPEGKMRIINFTETTEDGIFNYVDVNELVEIDSVGQCTGVYDRLADDIFEGDIVLFPDNTKIHIVKYINTGYTLTASNGNIMVYNFNPTVLEIIGNVYQNPELLTER